MAAGHDLLAKVRTFRLWHRDQHNPRLSKRHLSERDITVQFLEELEASVTSIISSRQASDQKAAAEATRADAAESEVATLKAQIAADEGRVKGLVDKLNAEVSAETSPASDHVATIAAQTGAPAAVVSAAVDAHADATATGAADPTQAAHAAAVDAGADAGTAAAVAQAVTAAAAS